MSQTQGEIWKEWAVAAQKGDKKAYNNLLSEVAVYVRNVIVSGLANPDWADDIVQDVLISVHKSLKTYHDDRPFKPWLMAIVGFRRTDFLRKHYSKRQDQRTSLEDPEFLTSHVTNMGGEGELKDIENALSSIPEDQQRVFKMIKIEGYTAKEVAQEMGMSESAVKVSAHRTQKKLQKMVG